MMRLVRFFALAILLLLVMGIASADAFHLTKRRHERHRHHSNRNDNRLLFRDTVPGPTIAAAWLSAHQDIFPVIKAWMNSFITQFLTGYTKKEMGFNPFGDAIVNLTNIVVHQFTCNDCIDISLTDGSATISLSNIALAASLDYTAHWHFLHSSGSCSPTATGVTGKCSVVFGAPSVNNTPTVVVNVGSFSVTDVSLNCNGALGWLANALTSIMKHLTGRIMNDALSDILAKEIDSELETLPLVYHFDDFTADFNLVASESLILGSAIELGVAGVFVPTSQENNSFVFPFPPPPASVAASCAGGMTSILLSTYTLDTLGYSAFWMGKLTQTFAGALTTSDLELIIPGFDQQLGPHVSLNLTLAALNPRFATSSSSIATSVPLNITIAGAHNRIYVVEALAIVGIGLTTKASSSDVAVVFQIANLTLANLKEVETNVGHGALPMLLKLLNGVLQPIVAGINFLMVAHPIPLPIIEGFQITQADITYQPDAVCVEVSVQNVN